MAEYQQDQECEENDKEHLDEKDIDLPLEHVLVIQTLRETTFENRDFSIPIRVLVFNLETEKGFQIGDYSIYCSLIARHFNLGQLQSLYINLYDKSIRDEDIPTILKPWIFYADQLRYVNLFLKFNDIGTDGADCLASFFGKCTNLESICMNLKYNKIKDAGLAGILSALHTLQRLRSLHLDVDHNLIHALPKEDLPKSSLNSLYLNFKYSASRFSRISLLGSRLPVFVTQPRQRPLPLY